MHVPICGFDLQLKYPFISRFFIVALYSFHAADEAEQNFSEDDGWEFVTLADQVTVT